MAEETKQLILSVFAGVRFYKGKKSYQWYNLDENENIADGFTMSKNMVPAAVGGVFETHQTDTSISTNGKEAPKYLKRFKDTDQVTVWAALDEAAKQELALKSLNTKAARVKPLEDALSDIEHISMNLNTRERIALIAKISEVILRV